MREEDNRERGVGRLMREGTRVGEEVPAERS